MKKFTAFLFIIFAIAVSCSKYDDSALWKAVNENSAKIAELQRAVDNLNRDVSTLQTLIDAVQNNNYITNVSELTDKSGYTITFSSGQSIVIYHGKNGENGTNGTNGENGSDGHSPKIGVAKDSDGIYYWTLDGEWLLDDNGEKIPVHGKDGINGTNGTNGTDGTNGKDGITPQFKIEDDYWFISYDNGASWTQLGKATGSNGINGKDGDTTIKSVDVEDGYVKFVLNDGNDTVIKLAFVKETKVLNIALEAAGTISNHVNVKDAAGVDKLICSGPINQSDLDFIYSYFYNTTEIDLSACEYDGYRYSMKYDSSNIIRNPFVERMFEKISLPKNLVELYLLSPYLKEVISQTSQYIDVASGTIAPGTYAVYDMTIPITAYNTYTYDGSKTTTNYVTLNKFEFAEGVTAITGFLSPFGGSSRRVLCDSLVFPSSIKTVANTMFYEAYNATAGSDMGFDEATYIVCKAVTPPTLTYPTSEMKGDCFYMRHGGGSVLYLSGAITNPLYVPAGSVNLYRAAPGWSQFKTILPIEE